MMVKYRRQSRYGVLGVFLLGVALAGTPVGTDAQQDQGLFSDVAADANRAAPAAEAAPDRAQLRARAVRVNFGRLPLSASVDKPARLVLNIFDDANFVAAIDKIEVQGLNSVSFLGHVEGFFDSPNGADVNQVSMVVLDGVMAGSIVTPTGSFQIGFDGTTHVVRQVDPGAYPEHEVVEPTGNLDARQVDPGPVAMNDNGSRIDLMVLYTTAARIRAGSTSAIEALITLGVTETNLAYERSGVVFRLRLRHMRETAYVETGYDLTNLTDGVGLLDVVPGLRDQYGADLVKLVTTNAGCGVAWLGGPAASMAAQQDRGFSVTQDSCISPNYTFGHELGHNQGNNHAPEDPTGTGAFNYSFGFKRCNAVPNFRSVMAYTCGSGATGTVRSLNFSNPAVNFGDAPTGVALQNNATSMNNVSVAVANWRQQTQEFPVTSLSAPGILTPGLVVTLRANVRNDTPYTATATQFVQFNSDGPGSGPGEGLVGEASLEGLMPGEDGSFTFDWTVPTDAARGEWTYTAIVWDTSLVEYRSDRSAPQSFTIAGLPTTTTPSAAAGQYSDIVALSAQVLPVGVAGSVTFSVDGGAPITATYEASTGIASVNYTVPLGAGTFAIIAALTSADPFFLASSGSASLTVTREDATVAPSAANPTSVKVASPGGTAPPFTLTAAITEAVDASPGNLSNAVPVSFALTPLLGGSPINCPATTSGGGLGGTLAATCTFVAVPVNLYTVTVAIGGLYYAGSATSIVSVYDPALGFVTGGGTVLRGGVRANFGFKVKFLKKGNLQGVFHYVEHRPSGDVTLKSNALGTLVIRGNSAVFNGKATVNGVGNFRFQTTVVDNGEPGVSDLLGLEVRQPNGAVQTDLTFGNRVITSGNIQVPLRR